MQYKLGTINNQTLKQLKIQLQYFCNLKPNCMNVYIISIFVQLYFYMFGYSFNAVEFDDK